MKISIIIPLYNEEESLPDLYNWISKILASQNFELIFVDDGSRDRSWQVIEELGQKDSRVL